MQQQPALVKRQVVIKHANGLDEVFLATLRVDAGNHATALYPMVLNVGTKRYRFEKESHTKNKVPFYVEDVEPEVQLSDLDKQELIPLLEESRYNEENANILSEHLAKKLLAAFGHPVNPQTINALISQEIMILANQE